MTEKFDFEKALEALKAGKPITGKDSVLGSADQAAYRSRPGSRD